VNLYKIILLGSVVDSVAEPEPPEQRIFAGARAKAKVFFGPALAPESGM
jgi:hypothetical protein